MRATVLRLPSLLLLCAATLAMPAARAQEVDLEALAMLEAADQVRFPRSDFEVNVRISSTTPGGETEVRDYQILSKGNENTLVITTAPASERGQVLLMRGRDLWVYSPRLSQPVRLPLSQRLTGQVANGDLARANFSGDYNARVLRDETIQKRKYAVLELTAIDGSVTYSRVLLWVERSGNQPLKAEFYALSGRLLKTAQYLNYAKLDNTVRPTQLVMEDAVKRGDRSVLDYSAMKPRELPNKLFNKDYMKRVTQGID
ncbi:outer membrane lipoprotein-sorting protein [Plasticicumulans sp.]|uniref:outer membrane lipoprotein-sorting protein n=1 Tax=Plasticicumulans sp. TaxID=2307179 RepID=UPI002BAAA8CA|nr:outer membrane lipoprotein-sorting protein [Plasticicumulans sp.]HNE00783.1 outer membrane lipoprotein-sorting protein [Plasticicumulans sp.]HNI23011.1 outer membrane lipoprotein-sorting protein [Plasticicumulans sp.]HNK31912.1 outer membrane lipoprotein-sorting protein [Plasticicumulans sp.]HNM41964.1 outer membrane lipoprotein-sorting protein [Plasticicumulans sp.]